MALFSVATLTQWPLCWKCKVAFVGFDSAWSLFCLTFFS